MEANVLVKNVLLQRLLVFAKNWSHSRQHLSKNVLAAAFDQAEALCEVDRVVDFLVEAPGLDLLRRDLVLIVLGAEVAVVEQTQVEADDVKFLCLHLPDLK